MFEVKITGNTASAVAANLIAAAAIFGATATPETERLAEEQLGVNEAAAPKPNPAPVPTEAETPKAPSSASKASSSSSKPAATPSPVSAPTPEPSAPTVTIEELRSLAADKIKADHKAEVIAIFEAHGAHKLTAIEAEEYAGVKADLEAL